MTPADSQKKRTVGVCLRVRAKEEDVVKEMLFIAAGGALGAVVRYGAGAGTEALFGARFPAGTLLVNVAGCFIIGLLAVPLIPEAAMRPARLGLIVGFLGALTTFSAFGIETVELYRQRGGSAALINVTANILLGLGAVVLGVTLSGALRPGALSGALPRASLRGLSSGPAAEVFEAVEPRDRLQSGGEARPSESDDNG